MKRLRAGALVAVATLAAAILAPFPATDVQAQSVTRVIGSGDPLNRVDIAVVGDGYTTAELPKYRLDVTRTINGFLGQDPFRAYRPYFNVHRVEVASSGSGADHPERVPPKSVATAFDASYNCAGIQRLICVDNSKVQAVLARTLLPTQHDLVLVLVNDPEYGGSGGAVSVMSTHLDVVELALHEAGHTFGLLADEYGGSRSPVCGQTEPAQPNSTASTKREQIKWSRWINATTAIPTTASGVVGAYPGALYCDAGVYRPTYDSKMRSLGRPFDPVNTEQLVRRIYNFVSPVDGVSPTSPTIDLVTRTTASVTVKPLVPSTHRLTTEWRLDGARISSGTSVLLDAATLNPGSHVLTATVADKTSLVRNDPEGLLNDSRSWSFTLPSRPASFAAIEDTMVDPRYPSTNFGGSTTLRARGGSDPARTYVKFDVRGLTAPVTNVRLRLRATESTAKAGEIRLVSTPTWSESTLTYSNQPQTSEEALASVGPIKTGDFVEFDVTRAVTGNGVYSFALISDNADQITYESSETRQAPRLLVYTGASAPSPTSSP